MLDFLITAHEEFGFSFEISIPIFLLVVQMNVLESKRVISDNGDFSAMFRSTLLVGESEKPGEYEEPLER
jgi:hypothetical protein